jgi:hypothetical protein
MTLLNVLKSLTIRWKCRPYTQAKQAISGAAIRAFQTAATKTRVEMIAQLFPKIGFHFPATRGMRGMQGSFQPLYRKCH